MGVCTVLKCHVSSCAGEQTLLVVLQARCVYQVASVIQQTLMMHSQPSERQRKNWAWTQHLCRWEGAAQQDIGSRGRTGHAGCSPPWASSSPHEAIGSKRDCAASPADYGGKGVGTEEEGRAPRERVMQSQVLLACMWVVPAEGYSVHQQWQLSGRGRWCTQRACMCQGTAHTSNSRESHHTLSHM
jgi:hypothetical protein